VAEAIGETAGRDQQRRDGRALLLKGARQLLAEKGYAGMELRDVAERGEAPRGSIYHHFPGGKAQLAREAAELEGETIRETIERSLQERGLKATLAMFGEVFRRRVADRRLPQLGRPDRRGAARRRRGPPRGRGLRRPRCLHRRGRPDPRPRGRQHRAARLGDRGSRAGARPPAER
jgi:AcrR family transcriptional regulator